MGISITLFHERIGKYFFWFKYTELLKSRFHPSVTHGFEKNHYFTAQLIFFQYVHQFVGLFISGSFLISIAIKFLYAFYLQKRIERSSAKVQDYLVLLQTLCISHFFFFWYMLPYISHHNILLYYLCDFSFLIRLDKAS